MNGRFSRALGRMARAAARMAIPRRTGAQPPIIIGPTDADPWMSQRAAFYLQDRSFVHHQKLSPALYLSGAALGYLGPVRNLMRLHPNAYNLDFRTNPNEGAEWALFANACSGHEPDVESARQRFLALLERLRKRSLGQTYIFGTGPSLSAAATRQWSDGYRIVCNTIVRDQSLWEYLAPDVMVAGDSIYHFGFTEFAKAFRRDLALRMSERPVPFLYPAMFDAIVQREFRAFHDYLIPVPIAPGKALFLGDMDSDFTLPSIGNVLNLLLLPLATTISRVVGLWGFDGRAPTDQGFWSNSNRHSYPELMHTLHEAHPAFFQEHVPAGKESRYVQNLHGDQLDRNLALLESRGWTFRMLHKSYTPTLARRMAPADAD